MHRRSRLGAGTLSLLRWVLTCAIGAITLGALLVVHLFPSSERMDASDGQRRPKQQHEIGYNGRTGELRWTLEFAPPQLSKSVASLEKVDAVNEFFKLEKLWVQPSRRNLVPCLEPSPSYMLPPETRGYLLVHTNGGLNQMRAGISDMVAIARIINATLVIPKLDKKSFWRDFSNFSDVFDEGHFIQTLEKDIKVIKKLPKNLAQGTKAVKYFRSWSTLEYYQEEISQLWNDYQVIRAAKSDSRLANNNLPIDIQKLRCRAFYEALQFAPQIKAFGNLLVKRMRSYGRYIALHLRYEKDMLAFSGCTYGLSPEEADELTKIRENTAHWIVKDIDPIEQRTKGYCPLTPKEVGIFLSGLGYPSNTPIYVAAGEIYGGDAHMADLYARFPMLVNKEKLASPEELKPFMQFASQMAALDYIVSVESDVFVPSYSGNMARAVAGHRRFLGHRKTITPDRKALVTLFDKIERGELQEGQRLSNLIVGIHRKRQGSPRKRKGPVSGTKGKERLRSEEAFYENPLPECLCARELLTAANSSRALLVR